jgi:hypothetical protein
VLHLHIFTRLRLLLYYIPAASKPYQNLQKLTEGLCLIYLRFFLYWNCCACEQAGIVFYISTYVEIKFRAASCQSSGSTNMIRLRLRVHNIRYVQTVVYIMLEPWMSYRYLIDLGYYIQIPAGLFRDCQTTAPLTNSGDFCALSYYNRGGWRGYRYCIFIS